MDASYSCGWKMLFFLSRNLVAPAIVLDKKYLLGGFYGYCNFSTKILV
jgi:hypothetical protein